MPSEGLSSQRKARLDLTLAGNPTAFLSPRLDTAEPIFPVQTIFGTFSPAQRADTLATDFITILLPCLEVFLYFNCIFYTQNTNHDFCGTPATAKTVTWHCSPHSSEDSRESTLSSFKIGLKCVGTEKVHLWSVINVQNREERKKPKTLLEMSN